MRSTCPSPPLSSLGEIVRGFAPNWFAATMGTGICALMLPRLPFPQAALLGEGLWWLNIVLFALFALLSLARALLYPADARATLRHPVQSMFLGAVPMGLATVINGLIVFGEPRWGAAAVLLARDLWLLDALLAAAVGLLLPYWMFTRQDHALERMSAVWLLPVVASEVAAASAGLIAPHLSVQAALLLVVAGYVLFALSVPLALLIIGILFLRLAQHRFPPAELGISMFLPVGPLATGALSLLQLADAAPAALAAQGLTPLGPAFAGLGLLGGLILWGFGGWWLALAALSTLRFLRRGLPFNLGWWGLTFPLGVFTAATFALGQASRLEFFAWAGNVLTVTLLALWTVVATLTVRGVGQGQLLPGLPGLKR
ncbi:C4-dicarboxylate transporter/malic acid transport protein [Deinobacterium chartae]|uniref:C4-dicarboxylate transporter/malic acid transport protein n=1 Tax=Deinobacterium chartae TaxID=521158 RepID=A0A841HTL0_9DEIO|nr:C4-dicarboxylate ABC transporter [Deinobacterium chartae]MBB6096751.1 C4-dicarboxylate transporter/malic acid transport protein [Deinobacterium chartae]